MDPNLANVSGDQTLASNPSISSGAPAVSASGLETIAAETLLQSGAIDPPPHPGVLAMIDRYPVLKEIGQGGMGLVFLARHPVSGAPVAIKVISPNLLHDPASVQRFLTEARHMSRLSHRNILKVMDVSDRPQGPYYVMAYMPSGSLAKLLEPGKPLDDQTTLHLARDVAEALAHAHERGIIHRDLKPANVLLDEQGHGCLADFGMVRTVFNDADVDVTTSRIEGTPAYMSPAMAAGVAEDTRCDIYAFGATLYEMLTGRRPYQGRSAKEVIQKIIQGPPPRIVTLNPQAPPGLVRIAEGAMARVLRDRYSSMADVLADLQRLDHGQAAIGPHGRESRKLPFKWLAAASFLVLAAAVGWIIAMRSHPRTPIGPSAASLPPPNQVALERPVEALQRVAASDAGANGPLSLPPPMLVTHFDGQGHRIVNLMPLIDLARDGVVGQWRQTREGPACDNSFNPKLRIPYDPPAEYDFKIEFTRLGGADEIVQVFPVAGKLCQWSMGASNGTNRNSLHGFLQNGLLRGSPEDLALRRNGSILVGKRYTSVVRVRNESISVTLNGEELVRSTVDPRMIMANGPFNEDGPELLVGSNHSPMVLHSIEVVEWSGPGVAWSHSVDDPQRVGLIKWDRRVQSVGFSRDGRLLIAGASWNNNAFEVKTGRGVMWFTCVPWTLSPDSRHLAVSSTCWVDLYLNRIDCMPELQKAGAWFTTLSANGAVMAVGFHDGAIRIFDTSSSLPRETRRFDGSGPEAQFVALSPTGNRVVSTDSANVARLIDISSGSQLWHAQCFGKSRKVEFDPSGEHVMIFAEGSRIVSVLNAASGQIAARCEHKSSVQDAVFSPAGKYLITADSDVAGQLHLWDINANREIQRFSPVGAVNGIAVSDDGRQLLAACADWTVRLFDIQSGKQIHRYAGHDKPVLCVAFSKDQSLAASGSEDRTVRTWRLREPPVKEPRQPAGPPMPASQPAPARVFRSEIDANNPSGVVPLTDDRLATHLDANGNRVVDLMPLVAPDRDGLVGTWHLSRNALTSDDADQAFLRLPFNPPAEYDFRIDFTRQSGNDEVWQIFDVRGQRFSWNMGARENTVHELFPGTPRNAPQNLDTRREGTLVNGRRYVSVVQVRWDYVAVTIDGTEIARYLIDTRQGISNPNDLRGVGLALGSQQGSTVFHAVELVELSGPGTAWPHARDDAALFRVFKAGSRPSVLEFSPGGRFILAGMDNATKGWDVQSAAMRFSAGGNFNTRWSMSSHDGQFVLADECCDLDAREQHDKRTEFNSRSNPSFSPHGTMLAAQYDNKFVRVFTVSTPFSSNPFRQIRQFDVPGAARMAFSPDDSRLVTADYRTHNVQLFDMSSGKELWKVKTDGGGRDVIRFDASGRKIITVNEGSRTAWVLNSDDGRTIAKCDHRYGVVGAHLSSDGNFLYTGDNDPDCGLHVWELATGKEVNRFPEIGPVNGIALSSDGRRLLAACSDGTVRLFDVATGRQLRSFTGHDRAATCVAFSPDESLAASGSDDCSIRLWKLTEPSATQPSQPK